MITNATRGILGMILEHDERHYPELKMSSVRFTMPNNTYTFSDLATIREWIYGLSLDDETYGWLECWADTQGYTPDVTIDITYTKRL